jgi:two-component system chemotaxis sensor kinase CheA
MAFTKVCSGKILTTALIFANINVFRNSVAHGIEDSEKRLELNKDEIGSIVCKIEPKDDYVNIIIQDDGAGIDIEKIKQKAKEHNIDTANMSESEILELIFMDNFSTANSVDEISGRGVGLGAVKSEIEKLGGSLKIETELNKGSSFIFTLPKEKVSKG